MNEFVGYIDSEGRVFDGTFDYEGHVGPIGPQGEPGYTPVRGIDYWTDEDKAYVVAEATSLINGKIEEYNANATAKTNAFNQNASDKTDTFEAVVDELTNAFVDNAADKTDDFNDNATSKTGDFNDNATSKTTAFDAHVDSEFDELTGNFYTKAQVDAKIASTYHYKGSVTDYTELPSSGQQVGDVYNIETAGGGYNAGDNVAWTGTAWDILAGTVDLTNYYTKSETNTLLDTKQGTIDSSHKVDADLIDDTTSTNKFTTSSDISKLSGIESGAEVNVIETVKVDGTALEVTDKSVNVVGIADLQDKYAQLLDQIPTNTATGTTINVQDSSNLPIKDFALGGNATQGADPTPDSPQDIHVVTGDNTVKVLGKNWLKLDTIPASNFNTTTYTSIGNIIEMRNRNGNIGRTLEVGTNYIKETKTNGYDWAQNVKFKNLKPNTKYKLSFNIETNIDSGTINIMGYTKQYSETTFAEIITTNSNGEAERAPHLYTSASQASGKYVYLTNIQLEEGETKTEYEAPVEQTQLISLGSIELAKIGTYQDRIYKSGGKWYKQGNIGKLTLNGSETGWSEISSSIPFRYSLNDLVLTASNTTKPFVISNYFPVDAWNNNTSYPDYFLSCTTNEEYLRFRNTDMLNLNSFKTWLSTHNTKVYYATTTPTYTEITDTTLIAQLENMLQKTTYKNVTNISIVPTGSNAEPTGEWEYRVDLGTVISNMNARLTLLE